MIEPTCYLTTVFLSHRHLYTMRKTIYDFYKLFKQFSGLTPATCGCKIIANRIAYIKAVTKTESANEFSESRGWCEPDNE